MRYIIALLIFISAWIMGSIVIWFGSGLIAAIEYDEGIFIGWGNDWRNRVSNIVAVITAVCLTTVYLRGSRKRIQNISKA